MSAYGRFSLGRISFPGIFLTFALGAAASAHGAATDAPHGRIVDVTVYADRAEIVRERTVDVPAGASVVEFRDLPLNVEPDSLRVAAKGVPAVLGAVTIRRNAEYPHDTPELIALRDEVKRLEGELAKQASRDTVASDLRTFLATLRTTTAQRASEQIAAGKSDPASIGALYDLMSTKLTELGDRDLASRDATDAINRDLQVARAKLSAAPAGRTIESRVAAAEIDAKQAGSLTVRLSYLVQGAAWSPAYRATLEPSSGEITLVSEAVVRQGTGEDWSGVALRLSTAAPARGVAPPQMASLTLTPLEQVITAGANAEFGRAQGGFAGVRERDKSIAGYQNFQTVVGGIAGEPVMPPPPPVPQDASPQPIEIAHSVYNVAFEVPGRSDVPADGAEHRMVLRQETLSGTLAYQTAPAIESAAFLTSVVHAPAQYPLLAGPMRVLAGGEYLGVYSVPETAPGAELTLPFGRDNRVKIGRVRQPQDRSLEGLTGKTRQVAYASRTSVENLRDRAVTIVVEDRVPVSEDERIVVDLDKSTTADHTPSKTRPGVVLWTLTLAPHEKKDVVLAYTVRYPKEMLVAGLE